MGRRWMRICAGLLAAVCVSAAGMSGCASGASGRGENAEAWDGGAESLSGETGAEAGAVIVPGVNAAGEQYGTGAGEQYGTGAGTQGAEAAGGLAAEAAELSDEDMVSAAMKHFSILYAVEAYMGPVHEEQGLMEKLEEARGKLVPGGGYTSTESREDLEFILKYFDLDSVYSLTIMDSDSQGREYGRLLESLDQFPRLRWLVIELPKERVSLDFMETMGQLEQLTLTAEGVCSPVRRELFPGKLNRISFNLGDMQSAAYLLDGLKGKKLERLEITGQDMRADFPLELLAGIPAEYVLLSCGVEGLPQEMAGEMLIEALEFTADSEQQLAAVQEIKSLKSLDVHIIPPSAGEGELPCIPPSAGEGELPCIPPSAGEPPNDNRLPVLSSVKTAPLFQREMDLRIWFAQEMVEFEEERYPGTGAVMAGDLEEYTGIQAVELGRDEIISSYQSYYREGKRIECFSRHRYMRDEEEKSAGGWESTYLDPVILITGDGIHQILDMGEVEGGGYRSDAMKFPDINSDGAPDITLSLGIYGTGATSCEQAWLWNPAKKRYDLCEGYADISNPRLDEEHQVIRGSWRNNGASHGWGIYKYIEGQGIVCQRSMRESLLLSDEYPEEYRGISDYAELWEITEWEQDGGQWKQVQHFYMVNEPGKERVEPEIYKSYSEPGSYWG